MRHWYSPNVYESGRLFTYNFTYRTQILKLILPMDSSYILHITTSCRHPLEKVAV